MSAPTTVPTARASEHAPGAAIVRGTVMGRYVILDAIGEGGMGTVFAAHDGTLDRTIALKLVRSELTDRESQARLVREAKAMARVQHPAIVAVHDVGTVGARVFVAMELVPGTTLRAWLDAEPRPWRDVVRVFVDAGRGLEAAHAAGVVHRDFKPENVLLDEAGRVRVTDFGLAHVLASDGEGTAPLSAGTPWYMPPEQLTHKEIDARSDQFSFCVALWQAVYGEHPFADRVEDLAGAVTRGEMRPAPEARGVRGGDPPRWLEAVLRRGLAVDPAARWGSMTELLAQLDRRPAARRWRALAVLGAGVAIGAAIMIARGGGGDRPACDAAAAPADGTWDAARRAQIARALGEPAAAKLDGYVAAWRAQRIDACRATHERGEQSGDLLDLRMQCLDRRLGELDALAALLATGEATVIENAGDAIGSLVPVSACANVAALREVVPPPLDPRQRERVDAIRNRLAAIKADLDTGRYKPGLAAVEPLAREAIALGYQPLIAEVELMHGSLAWRSDRGDDAEAALLRAIASGEAGRAGDIVAQGYLELVWFVGQERQRPAEALRLGRLAQGAVARYGGAGGLDAALAERLGVTALDLGKLDEAEPDLRRAYELRLAHYGGDHPDVGASLQHLAILAGERGDHETAIERHRRAYDMIERGLGKDHPHSLIALNALAGELQIAGRAEEALPLLERGLASVERTLGPDTFDAAMYHHNLSLVLTKLGRHTDAIAHQRHAHEVYIAVRGADSAEVANHRAELARTLWKAGHLTEAIAEYREATAAIERASGRDAAELAEALTGLGLTLVEAKRPREAEPVLRRALELRERAGDAKHAQELREELAGLR